MRIGANLPGPFWVSWHVGGRRRRRHGRAGAGAGFLGLLVLPFLLPWLICVGIASLYQFAWTKPATTGRKVASVAGVSLGLLVVLVIGAASGGGSPSPSPVPAARAAPVTASTPTPSAAPTPSPSPTRRAAPASKSSSPAKMDHSPPAPSSSAPAAATPVPVPTSVPPSTPAPACSPTTSGGRCYEPGEFCPKRDRGLSGTAGDGQPITCQNQNGWRWEG